MPQDSNLSPTLVSIIIPVYNTGEYLNQCLQSCLDQTYQNIEIIAIDDCSTDEYTREILRKFEAKDPRVKVIWLPENHGQGYCRNIGTDTCKGKYFTFIDSDDYFKPEFIEKMYKGLEEFHTDFAICDTYNYVENPAEFKMKQFTLNDSETRFNFNAPDRTVIENTDLSSVGFLITFPASCYSKVFNTARYRECGIRFDIGPYAKHCEDEDWATLSILNLKNFLVLKFVGLMRRMHPGSVSMPSASHYRCAIDATWRRYSLIQKYPFADFYNDSIVYNFLEAASRLNSLLETYPERLHSIDTFHEYLAKFGSVFNTNPYYYSYKVSKGWHTVLGLLDSKPLPLVYFSLSPLHNSFNAETYYTKQLLENLAAQGIFTSSFNALKIDNYVPIQIFQTVEKELIARVKQDIENEQKAAIKAYKAGLPVTPDMTPTKPYAPNSALLEFKNNGVSYLIAKTTPCDRPELYTHLDIEIIRQGIVKTVKSYFKNKDTGIVMFSGGDFVTQTMCAILKQKGYKVVYLVSCSADLNFDLKKDSETLMNQAEKLVKQSLENVLNGVDTDDIAEPQATNTADTYDKDTSHGASADKSDGDKTDGDKHDNDKSDVAQTTSSENKEISPKPQVSRGKQEPVFNTNSKYIFDPHDFDAVFGLNPYYAERFSELYSVKTEYLGCALNPWVEMLHHENSHSQIICHKPTIQNGLAVMIKIVQRFRALHPSMKFTFFLNQDNSFQNDLAKLHDTQGNSISSYKKSLSNILLVSDQAIDPLSLAGLGAVVLKPMIAEEESLSGLFEAVYNDVPILGSNSEKLRLALGDSVVLVDLPASTLKDPTCIPSDEEIEPWVKALEKLVEQPWQAKVTFDERKDAFDKTMRRWMERLYEIANIPEEHDHEGDIRSV